MDVKGSDKTPAAIDELSAVRSGLASAQFRRQVGELAATARAAEHADTTIPPDAPPSPVSEAPAPDAPSEVQTRTGLLHRAKRRLIRLARPFALPFLHRFQLRLAHAVETSAILHDLKAGLHRQTEQLNRQTELVENLLARSDKQELVSEELRSLVFANRKLLTALSAAEQTNSPKAASLSHKVEEVSGLLRTISERQTTQIAYAEHLIRSRIIPLGDEVLVRTSFGWLFVPVSDHPIITGIGETGDALEPGTVAVIRAILKPGDLVVDVGANVGSLLLPMAERVGPDGRLIACEPTPACISALRNTIAVNGLETRVDLKPVAVGSSEATARLHLGTNSSFNSLAELEPDGSDERNGIDVEVSTLDRLVPSEQSPALVKIDVEGLELEVLRGMNGILSRSPDIALVAEYGPSHLERIGVRPQDWLAEFQSHGFALWIIDERDGSLREASSEALEGIYSANILMVRRDLSHWPDLKAAS
ncbi:FkbM family methyltransferase [Fulvimarina endophytica]|uniref:FkbM family methyltransferase n=1 Tax=Fulvimarina endophytica TaxID=2293836 RepID=A0A371X338_9HYPH|nr:FkbM family methyltransferase [Fulvimarina endophytica]RFC63650.1 FkbM family methyltransferase [Fulvimarina endophytica]